VFFDGFFMWALLSEFGIKAWNHYSPMHLSTSFRSRMLGKVGDCPVAEAKFEEYVSLPIHPRLTDEAVAYMIDAIKQLSQRPHLPRLCPAPLLSALTSLYVPKVTMHTSDSPAENDWQHFKSEVLTSHTLFSTSAPVIASRAPGRLDLMGIQFSAPVFDSSPHLVAQVEMTITRVAWCLSAQYQKLHLSQRNPASTTASSLCEIDSCVQKTALCRSLCCCSQDLRQWI
jgi:hypothetical protein